MKLTSLSIILVMIVGSVSAQRIDISTDKTDLILKVGDNGRLYQTYLGEKLLNRAELDDFSWQVHGGSDGSISARGWEGYAGKGKRSAAGKRQGNCAFGDRA